ncbi:MAG: SigE family RNA polymerase sigma factor [Micromonosporaceae bacterium]
MRDASTFDELYRATSRRLMHYAYALTGDLGEAQDLVQEVYIRAWQRWNHLRHYDSIEAWLRLVLSRLATDRWRRLRSLRVALTRSGPPGDAAPPGDEALLLVWALRQLPETQRRALALHHLFDLPVDEVATEIGVPVGTVKSWLARGRTALAAALTESGGQAKEVNDVH